MLTGTRRPEAHPTREAASSGNSLRLVYILNHPETHPSPGKVLFALHRSPVSPLAPAVLEEETWPQLEGSGAGHEVGALQHKLGFFVLQDDPLLAPGEVS